MDKDDVVPSGILLSRQKRTEQCCLQPQGTTLGMVILGEESQKEERCHTGSPHVDLNKTNGTPLRNGNRLNRLREQTHSCQEGGGLGVEDWNLGLADANYYTQDG